MVNLDRVEMLRTTISGSERTSRTIGSPEEEQSVPVAIQKQKQTMAVTDRISTLRDYRKSDQQDECREESIGPETANVEESPEESRQDAPVANEMRNGGNNQEENFIEAEFETVLEADYILSGKNTPMEEDEDRYDVNEESSQKSDSIHEIKTQDLKEQPTADTRTEQPLMSIDEEEIECGIEVEYGRSVPFSTSEDDERVEHRGTEADSKSVDDVEPEQLEQPEAEVNETKEEEAEEQTDSDEATRQETTDCVESEKNAIDFHKQPAISNDDATQESNFDHLSLLSTDATWSFDTTLKRKKVKKTKSRVAKNIFLGFEEEDENNVAGKNGPKTEEDVNDISSGKDKDIVDAGKDEARVDENEGTPEEDPICEREEIQPIDNGIATADSNQITTNAVESTDIEDVSSGEDEDVVDAGKDETRVDGNEGTREEEPTCEKEDSQPVDNDTDTDNSDQITTDVAESTDEDAEVYEAVQDTSDYEAGQDASDSQSVEFDVILENVAEHIENSDWDAFITAVTSRPSLATLSSVDFFPSECTGFLAVGASENLLLHEVCKNEPSVEAVTTLIEVHDTAVKTAGQWGYLPIHCACAAGASEDVIRALLKAHSESIESFGDDKMFPLHLACKRGAPMGIFELLLISYPSACVAEDVYEKTPMDYVLSLVEGPERAKKLELLGRHIQTMYLSTADIMSENRQKVFTLERDLTELFNKSLSLEGDLKGKQERSSDLGEQLKANQEKVVELERELGMERAKASVFGENLKKELAKSHALEGELRDDRTKASHLETELKTNCDEWSVLGAEMEEEFKKSSAELNKERTRIAELEKKLTGEKEKCSIFEGQLQNQREQSSSLDVTLNAEREKVCAVQEKLAAAKLRWLIEKQAIYERDGLNLAGAYQLLLEESKADATPQKERWLAKRNEIFEKNDIQMADAYNSTDKHACSLFERQAIYEKVDHQLIEAYKIICKTEVDLKQERTKWLLERQIILEKNDHNMAEAFSTIRDTGMSLAAKSFKLEECEGVLNERQTQIKREHDKSTSLLRELELAKAISGEKLSGLVDELNLQKSFSESQSKQIKELESSIELKLADVNECTMEQQDHLTYETSMANDILVKISEKKKLMQENQQMIHILEKSNLMKQELLEGQQKKVEALEVGRREKETQLKLNQRGMKQLEESIIRKEALEKEELAQASKLAGTRASRKAAIDIEEDHIKELDYTLARKQALVELEKMKEKTLQQTIAQKHELIESEVTRIKELELLVAEKQMYLMTERNTMQALKAVKAEKDDLLVSEMIVVSELRKTLEEKEKILQAQKKTEASIQSHLKEEETLLASKQAAIESVKEAHATMEVELKNQKNTTSALENQIARKESLVTKEEYVAKCLQRVSSHKREVMPAGAFSYFVSAYFGMQFRADFSIKFLLKETHLVSTFIKTQIREQSAAVRQRRDEALALVPAVPVPSLDLCRTVVSKGPQSLLARLRSFGVNVDRFPKSYAAATPPIKKKPPTPESQLPKWTKKASEL